MQKTSLTHPLRIDEIGCGPGTIGMTLCPGKQGPSEFGGVWDRDLALDVARIARWAPDAVVTLMEEPELDRMGLGEMGAAFERARLDWRRLAVADGGIPDERFERLWTYYGHALRSHLRKGGRVLLHCRGGLGRTGVIAARLLIEFGAHPEEAIHRVRAARPGAIETPSQEAYLRSRGRIAHCHEQADRTLAVLIGGALGDALGYPIEFEELAEIKATWGDQGLTEPVYRGDRLVVSDDTQMTLFTAEGLSRAFSRDTAPPCDRIIREVRLAYLDWYRTQDETMPQSQEGISRFRVLHRRRAPGTTCLSALAAGGRGTPDRPVNDSKGCGGTMRVAPIGLLPQLDLEAAFELADSAAAITHGHPSGRLSAAALACLVRDLIAGTSLESALTSVRHRLAAAPGGGETAQALECAERLARDRTVAPTDAIGRLGRGWTGEEALAIAVYAVARGGDFRAVIRRAANHDGDSDSTASIAGQIYGAAHGLAAMPPAWIGRLDVIEPLCEAADGLLTVSEPQPAPVETAL